VREDLIDLIGRPLPTVHAIYNPVDWQSVQAKALEAVDVQSYRPYFVNMGRLSPQKDQATLIDAFVQFNRSHDNAYHLLILGRGECEAALRAQCDHLEVNAFVHLLGFCDNPWAYLSHAVALISTSLYEGFSLVLMEAAAIGTPVISTDCESGPREVLADGRNGYLVPIHDPDRLADAMHYIISNPDEAREKAERSRAFVRVLEPSKVAQQYLDIFASASKTSLT
jgi:glycosyltransferase involved in cell wall biosynthesis